MVSRWGGTHSDDFEGVCPVENRFLSNDFVSGAFGQSLSDDGGDVLCSYPANDHVFRATEKRISKGRIPPVYTCDCEGVLFTHELVRALLPFLGTVAVGDMVAVEALMRSNVVEMEDGEGEAR